MWEYRQRVVEHDYRRSSLWPRVRTLGERRQYWTVEWAGWRAPFSLDIIEWNRGSDELTWITTGREHRMTVPAFLVRLVIAAARRRIRRPQLPSAKVVRR